MPKYSAWYDHSDPANSRLMHTMADLRRMCCRAEHTNPRTRQPGSFEAIERIKRAIDEWARCETGRAEYFWDKPPRVG